VPSTTRRRFGALRQLPSGRWQARYPDPGGGSPLLAAPQTFRTKTDAARYLAAVETDVARGTWLDPRRSGVTLATYAQAWLGSRRVKGQPLAPSTLSTYRRRLEQQIIPALGELPLDRITSAAVRRWHADVTTVGATTAAQAYRLLHAVLATAVADGDLARNPCQVKGAGQPPTAERPLVDRAQVQALAEQMPAHLHAFVLLAFWGGLRLGELLGLEAGDVTLDRVAGRGSVRVQRQQQDVDGRTLVTAPKAGSARTVHLPSPAVEALAAHLAGRPLALPNARVFTRPDGLPLRGFDVHRHWDRAREAVGQPGLHVHDLRHAGLTLAAQTGATLAEVMRRAGHSTSRAALIYQHAAEDRDCELAARMGAATGGTPAPVVAREWHAEVIQHPSQAR